jgi:hypothetical protein
MSSTKAQWKSGKLSFYDGYETVKPLSPVVFEDDFLGYKLNKYIANENTTAPWGSVETAATVVVVANTVNGVVQLAITNADSTQIACLHWGDQLALSLLQGLIFETRMTFSILPASGTGPSIATWGLASAHNATIDNVGTNAWFRVASAAPTALLWETDIPGGTDDDANAIALPALVATTYHIYRIDCRDGVTAKFYVDNALVGSGDIATGMSAGTDDLVQPYFNMQKVKGAGNTAIGTMDIDYVKVWQNRS